MSDGAPTFRDWLAWLALIPPLPRVRAWWAKRPWHYADAKRLPQAKVIER